MKKTLLALGTLATIVTPVATVISCSNEIDRTGFSDGYQITTDGGAAIDKMMAGYETTSPYQNFALDKDFVSARLFNSKTNGIVMNATISNWYKGHNAIFFTSWEAESASHDQDLIKKVAKDYAKPDVDEVFSKQDIIRSADFFDKELDSFNLDSSKHYIYSVDVTAKDDAKANSGKYTVKVWETKDDSTAISDAADVLTNDFEFKEQHIKDLQGTYIFSQPHVFKLHDSFGLEGMSSKAKGDYKDRATNDNLVDWTAYGPKAALTNDQKAKLKDIEVMSKIITDNKTHEQNVQLTIKDKAGETKTIYVATTKIAELNETKTFDTSEFAKAWREKMQFKPVYDLFGKLKNSIGQLNGKGMSGMLDYIVNVISKINFLASTYDFSNTDEFIKGFGEFLEKDPTINAKAMLNAINNFDAKEYDNILSVGAKGFMALYWIDRVYDKFDEYFKQEAATHNRWIIRDVKTPETLNAILVKEANKQKLVVEAKKFLDAHIPAVSYSSRSDDDILKLVSDTKADDYKVAIAALSSDVAAEKTVLEGLSDKEIDPGWKRMPSLRSVELFKFLDAKWTIIFGADAKTNPTIAAIDKWNHVGTFESLKDSRGGHGKTFPSGNIRDIVSTIISKMPKAEGDKLTAAVFEPLGLVI